MHLLLKKIVDNKSFISNINSNFLEDIIQVDIVVINTDMKKELFRLTAKNVYFMSDNGSLKNVIKDINIGAPGVKILSNLEKYETIEMASVIQILFMLEPTELKYSSFENISLFIACNEFTILKLNNYNYM